MIVSQTLGLEVHVTGDIYYLFNLTSACGQECATQLPSALCWAEQGAGHALLASGCAAPSVGPAGACPLSTTPTSPGKPALTPRPAPSR